MDDIEIMKQMVQAAVHFGHKTAKWNPKMKKYIYGERDGIHVFDLFKSKNALDMAMDFVRSLVKQNKTILLVSTKKQAQKQIESVALEAGMPFISQKWIGGLLTNFDILRKRIKYFNEIRELEKKGELLKYTKKEVLKIKKNIEKLEVMFGGVAQLSKIPDALFLLDTVRDNLALSEAKKMNIPVVGIVDTNSDPTLLNYPIPGNDDALKSIEFFLNTLKNTIIAARQSNIIINS